MKASRLALWESTGLDGKRDVGSKVSSGCRLMFESKWSGVCPRIKSTWRLVVSRIVETVVAQQLDVATSHSSYPAGNVVARVSLVEVRSRGVLGGYARSSEPSALTA